MKKRRAVAIATMASTLYAVACSVFVDTADLSGESAPDAATEGTPLAESGADTGSVDTGSVDAGKRCDATFCDDFDEGELGAKWTSKEVTNGGVLELGVPAKSALRTSFGSAGGSDRSALLEQDLGTGTRLRCEFAMFLEKRPSTRSMDVLRIRTTAQGVANYNLLFGVSPAGSGTFREDVFLPDGGCGCPRKEANPPTFPDARWVRVTVEVSFATAAASVAYDGQVIAAGMFGGITPTSSVFVAVGSLAYDPQPSVILFDDFSCTLSP